jgi:hypothetical protein
MTTEITVKMTQEEFEAMLDTCNRVIQQESYTLSNAECDPDDAIDVDSFNAHQKADLALKVLREKTKKHSLLFDQLLHAAFVNELDLEFMEFPLKPGFLVFFVDSFTDEMQEVRALKSDGTAVLRGCESVVKLPEEKDAIMVTTVVSW